MGHIDIRKMETGIWILQEEAQRIESLARQAEEFVADGHRKMSAAQIENTGLQTALGNIQETAQSLEREAHILRCAADILRRISLLYRKTELRVLDICLGEYVVIPRTEFGLSHFDGLAKYRDMLRIDEKLSEQNTGSRETADQGGHLPAAADGLDHQPGELGRVLQ